MLRIRLEGKNFGTRQLTPQTRHSYLWLNAIN